jgi:hypothetical protein
MPAWTQEINLQEHCKNKTKQLSFGQVCFEFYLGTSMQASKTFRLFQACGFCVVPEFSFVKFFGWLYLSLHKKNQSTRNKKNKTFY